MHGDSAMVPVVSEFASLLAYDASLPTGPWLSPPGFPMHGISTDSGLTEYLDQFGIAVEEIIRG